MANVTVKVLKGFRFGGSTVKKGEEISMSPANVQLYGNLGFIKVDKATGEKVETALEKEKAPKVRTAKK
jgi:hypothetical protein